MTPLLTVPQVAERVQLDETTVRRAIRRGELRASKLCGQLRVDPAALTDWIDGNTVTPPVQIARAPAPRAPRAVVQAPGRPGGSSFRDKVRNARKAA